MFNVANRNNYVHFKIRYPNFSGIVTVTNIG